MILVRFAINQSHRVVFLMALFVERKTKDFVIQHEFDIRFKTLIYMPLNPLKGTFLVQELRK